ncbi:hypothetical protein RQP46_007846 [Phenoliferia psychrophenolica]
MLSKGGVKVGEDSRAAAEREANEEGGYTIGSATSQGTLMMLQDPDGSQSYAVELLHVADESATLEGSWREKDTRQRKWVTGWTALENAVKGGRREAIWAEMVKAAKAKV